MKAKKNLVYAGIIAAAAILVMALYVFVISPKLVEPADTYSKAVKLYNDGDYMRSALMLESIKNYSDSKTLSKRAWKRAGDAAYDEGRYEEASACYKRGGSEEDLGKVDDCFIRLAKEEFRKLDPVKGEIYLSAVSGAAGTNLIYDARIEGAKSILEGTDDPDIIKAAVNLLEPCYAERAAEITELLAAGGENYLENLNIGAAEVAFRGAANFCPEDTLPVLNGRIERALRAAAKKAQQAGDNDLAQRMISLADKYAENAKPAEGTDEERIERATALIDSGDYIGAYAILSALPKDSAAEPLLEAVLFYYRRMPCAGANDAYVLLGMDGKAEFCGIGWGAEVPSWKNCRMAAMGYGDFALGLTDDGTVITAGDGSNGQLAVDGWTGIVQLAAGAKHSLGLRSDGTVTAAGWNAYGQTNVSTWNNIKYIAAGKYASYGVKTDGTVVAVGLNDFGQLDVTGWTNIVTVSAGRAHAVGLCADGTVVACGDNNQGQCDVGSWTDIVMVSASANHTVGLRADGTLVACGDNNNGQDEVGGITGAVAVACGNGYTLVVLADGSVVVLGDVG